jgi:hypothetical protein
MRALLGDKRELAKQLAAPLFSRPFVATFQYEGCIYV